MGLRSLAIVIACLSLVSCSEPVNTLEKDEPILNSGQNLYNKYCISCHGEDGKLGASGSLDLSTSTKGEVETKNMIKKGGKGMPQFEHLITSDAEMEELLNYVISLRE